MCHICILLDNTFPSPKSLVRTARELDLDVSHFLEIYNKAVEKLGTEEEKEEFTQGVIAEDYLEHLRMT